MKDYRAKFCKDCGGPLTPLSPPVEDYLDVRFSIKIPFTTLKVALINDEVALACEKCICEKAQRKHQGYEKNVYGLGYEAGFEKGYDSRERGDL